MATGSSGSIASPGHSTPLLLAGCILGPAAFTAYTTLLSPRPYHIFEMDGEAAYYYSARLLYAGQATQLVPHPGTPVAYLGYLLMLVAGPDLDAVQRFFDLGYLVAALVTAAALGFFVRALLAEVPTGTAVVALTAIVIWPPFLTFLNYFHPESFVVALGLPALALFWRSLDRGPDRGRLFLCGAGIGAALACKLTFAPVALALLVGTSIQIVRSARRAGARRRWLVLTPAGTVTGFLALTAPHVDRLPTVILWTLARGDIRPKSVLPTLHALVETAWPFVALTAVAAATCLFSVVRHLRRCTRPGGGGRGAGGEDGFDHLAAGVFVLLMLGSLVYTLAAAVARRGDPGVWLRNASPAALSLPFLVLYGDRLLQLTRAGEAARPRAIWPGRLLVATALILTAVAVMLHLDRRGETVRARRARIAVASAELGTLPHTGARAAIWDGDRTPLGEASFHFWGNYRYGRDYFDPLLLERYPRYTLLRLREVGRIVHERDAAGELARSGLRPGRAEPRPPAPSGPYRFLTGTERRWTGGRSDEIVTGESRGIVPSVAAVSARELARERTTLAELVSVLERRFGRAEVSTRSIAGREWAVITVAETARASPAPLPR